MSAAESETVARSEAEWREQELSRHELTLLASNEAHHLHVYGLARPGDSNHANVIVFSRFGIAIHGDTCFGGHDQGMAVSGARCKGPGWFAGDLSEDYLAGKFLHRNNWTAERAAERIRYAAQDMEDEKERTKMLALAENCRDDDYDMPHELMEALYEDRLDGHFEGCPGYGYDESALGWLVAIQKRFAALYAALRAASAPTGGTAA